MKFKKIIIDGKVYYEEDVSGTYEFDIENDVNEEEPEVVDVDDDSTFTEKVKKYTNKINEKMKKIGSQLSDECKDLASQIKEATFKFEKKIKKAQDEEVVMDYINNLAKELKTKTPFGEKIRVKIDKRNKQSVDNFFTFRCS